MTALSRESVLERQRASRPRRRKQLIRDVVIVLASAIILAVLVFPFAWMVLSSLRPTSQLFLPLSLETLFGNLSFTSYQTLFESSNFARYILNSALIASATTLLSVMLATFAGYAFSRYTFPAKTLMIIGVVGTQLFPFVILITPVYAVFQNLGLLNTYFGVVVAYIALTLPFSIVLLMGYMSTISHTFDDAARVDGCSTLGVIFRVIIPIAWPGIIVVGVNCFINIWEEFLFAQVLMTDESMKTVQVGLSNFFGEYSAAWDLVMAASVVASLPTIVLFFILQKRLVAGISAGGIKG